MEIGKDKLDRFMTNEVVSQRADDNRQLINLIRERQVRWIGHVIRNEPLLKDILEDRIKGNKFSPLDDNLRLICFLSTSVYSALGVSAIMRYINRRFTYLLTYLLYLRLTDRASAFVSA